MAELAVPTQGRRGRSQHQHRGTHGQVLASACNSFAWDLNLPTLNSQAAEPLWQADSSHLGYSYFLLCLTILTSGSGLGPLPVWMAPELSQSWRFLWRGREIPSLPLANVSHTSPSAVCSPHRILLQVLSAW